MLNIRNRMKNHIKLFTQIHETKYIRNIQSHRGKANIHYEIEENNEYDNEAILIYTYNRKKEKIKIGYIQKKEFVNHIYSERAEALYEEYQNMLFQNGKDYYDDNILDLKSHEKWAEVIDTVYNYLHTEEELEQIKKDIENGFYNFVYDYDEKCGYLILNKKCKEQFFNI